MRSQWIDKKTGKVINLSNFAYAGISGWNGYAENYATMLNGSLSFISSDKIIAISGDRQSFLNVKANVGFKSHTVKITGLDPDKTVDYWYFPDSESTRKKLAYGNGIHTIPKSVPVDDAASVGFWINRGSQEIIIEQLPLYPGALVSDGVDDYGQTAEAISDEVGTVLAHMSDISSDSGKYYILFGASNIDPNRYALFEYSSTKIAFYAPEEIFDIDEGIFAKSKTPVSVNTNLFVCAASPRQAFSRCALYRLILIREQLDDAAVEFLKWKVDKEHRDWLKEKGWAA